MHVPCFTRQLSCFIFLHFDSTIHYMQKVKMVQFFYTLTHLFTACKWPKYAIFFFAFFLHFDSPAIGQNGAIFLSFFMQFASRIHNENGAAWKSVTWPQLQSREGWHNFTISMDDLDSISCKIDDGWWMKGFKVVKHVTTSLFAFQILYCNFKILYVIIYDNIIV